MSATHALCGRLRALILALAAVALATVGYAQKPSKSADRAHNKLRITGSLVLFPLVTDIARRFEESHPGIKIEVQAGGAIKGTVDVRSGASDIGMLPRGLRDADRELFAFPIARDGIAVIVNGENNLTGITTNQLSGILTGKISNWSAVGGRDAPVALALRREGEGSTEIIVQHLKLQRAQLTQHTPIVTTADAIAFVSTTPNGVALASIGGAERLARDGVPIKLLSYNGFPARSRTIQNHLYALSRPLTLITRKPPEGLQKQFIDYALSPRVTDLLLKYGFVPYEN
jgi:phosphate transport system substrate-binding protein